MIRGQTMLKKIFGCFLIFIFLWLILSRLDAPNNVDFIKETPCLDFRHPNFTSIMKRLLSPEMNLETKLERLFYFIRDEIPFASTTSLKASDVLFNWKALCYHKAMLYVSFCRRLGVPARLAAEEFVIRGDVKKLSHLHGISKIFYRGKWLYLDTVSNRNSWWQIKNAQEFIPPVFSLRGNVLVNQSYFTSFSLRDYDTNDVPSEWIDHIRRYLKTGRW
jgi:hypothetical protein